MWHDFICWAFHGRYKWAIVREGKMERGCSKCAFMAKKK